MAAVNDILRATLSGQIAAVDLFNLVFHYRVTVGSETNYSTILLAIMGAWTTAFDGMEANISTEIVGDTGDLWEWDFVNNEFDGKASGLHTALLGEAAGFAEPNGIAALMRFATTELRRQARKFIPGLLEADVTNDALQSGILTPAIATAALLNDDIVAGGATLRPCVFNSTPLSSRFETSADFIQTSFVNALVAYQRRRQPGSGA